MIIFVELFDLCGISSFLLDLYALFEGLYVNFLRTLCNLHYLQVITFMAPCLYT